MTLRFGTGRLGTPWRQGRAKGTDVRQVWGTGVKEFRAWTSG